MRMCVNGVVRDASAEELSLMKAERIKAEQMERSRPLTEAEISRMLITRQINSLDVNGNTALRMKEFYPAFDSIVGQTVAKGFKFTHGDKLWQVIQPEITIQSHYVPGTGTESLYAEVVESHEGTENDPIPYGGNMALECGKYYVQDFAVFRCTQDTGNPVYHPLRELAGVYVEEVYL